MPKNNHCMDGLQGLWAKRHMQHVQGIGASRMGLKQDGTLGQVLLPDATGLKASIV